MDALLADTKLGLVREFTRTWGVGGKKAEALVKKGYRSLEDLKKVGVSGVSGVSGSSSVVV